MRLYFSGSSIEEYCDENYGHCEIVKIKISSTSYIIDCENLCISRHLQFTLVPHQVSAQSNKSSDELQFTGYLTNQEDSSYVSVLLSNGIVRNYL